MCKKVQLALITPSASKYYKLRKEIAGQTCTLTIEKFYQKKKHLVNTLFSSTCVYTIQQPNSSDT